MLFVFVVFCFFFFFLGGGGGGILREPQPLTKEERGLLPVLVGFRA